MSIKQAKEGGFIKFTGYTEEPEEGQDLLVEGDHYQIEQIDLKEKSVVIRIDNPDFNAKKKESEANPKTLLLDVFEEEFELVVEEAKAAGKGKAATGKGRAAPKAEAEADAADGQAGDTELLPTVDELEAMGKPALLACATKFGVELTAVQKKTADGIIDAIIDALGIEVGDEQEQEEEEEQEAHAPAKPAGKAKVETKPAAKADAKPATKGKAAAKTETKPAGKAKSTKLAAKAPPAEDSDPYADLSEADEDQDILALVNESEDILDLARETVEEANAVEYRLGGILFHVRKSEAYKEIDDRYKEKGGFSLYLIEELNVEYRKAMYLVDIYYKWNKFGLDADKVASIGWAKAAKIAAVMTEDTAEELLALAENNTVADLVDNIKTNYKEVGGTKGDKKLVKVFKFRLFEDQAVSVEEVLNSVASQMGFTKLDDAFEHIIMEWATEHPQSTPAAKTSAKPTSKVTQLRPGQTKTRAGK